MLKDTFFNVRRFTTLCRKEMVESWKVNVLRMILLYGFMSIVFLFIGFNTYDSYAVSGMMEDSVAYSSLIGFVWFLWIFGCLSASLTMERMKTKTSRLSVLMIPATPFEKFFSRWVVFTLVFMVVFLIAFLLADYTRVLVCSLSFPDVKVIAPTNLKYLLTDGTNHYCIYRSSSQFLLIVSGYFFLQSCFVLGSSIWPKNSFLKTFVAGILLIIVYLTVGASVAKMFFTDRLLFNFNLDVSKGIAAHITSAFLLFFVLFNWVLAYFRFKEAEIINRM
ncbi:hypothetical protein [uncultured Bacteroides sp.]|uniref:hypothetical protein n=1 Tax=uncultured Bacteroides sp. TaxID=162156 RepID=UPI002AA6EDFB|nr:hypothetical protein [uncultured Bacteroides sp.]